MAKRRCKFGRVKSGARKGRCRYSKRSASKAVRVKGQCVKWGARKGRRKPRCLKRAQVDRRCVKKDARGRCREYEYKPGSVGFDGLLGLGGLFGLL